jgi:hypothetical protein
MAFVIWYRVELQGGAPGPKVTVSNDVFGADWLCDAVITVTMRDGASTGGFGIELTNLPAAVGKHLKARHEKAPKGKPLMAAIYLGYFDDVPLIRRPQPVMIGAATGATGVKTSVSENGALSTTINGQEFVAWKLLGYENVSLPFEGSVTPKQALDQLVEKVGVTVAGQITGPARDHYTLRAPNGLDAVDQIARWAGTPVVLRDGKIVIGRELPPPGGPDVDENTNAVKVAEGRASEKAPRSRANGVNAVAQTMASTVYDATVLGDNLLRAGQQVTVKVTGEQPVVARVQILEHRFSTADTDGGYTCEMRLVDPAQTSPPAFVGAHGVVRRMRDITDAARDARPFIDVGEVTQYKSGADGKHLVTLNYGQSPASDAVEPSVETPVDDDSQLHDKPIASPFAWDKCGLVVPAYPGQRALLAHNDGDPNDAVVAGYLWAEDPLYERPKNKAGDWWLCLPTKLEGDAPAGKGVNDLIDAGGLRVVQAKGLRITVGEDTLPNIGERPSLPDADQLLIEHKTGTTVTIADDGAVEVKTDRKDVSLTNGSVTLKLSSSAVDVS